MRTIRTILTGTLALGLLAVPTVATAQSDDPRWPNPEGATMFTGRIAEGAKLIEDVTNDEGLYIGGLEEASWVEVSDSRLDGNITIATSATSEGLGPTLDSDVISNAYRIETGDGAWIGQPSAWFWLEDDTISSRVHVLAGQEAYEGMTALMELSGDLSWTGPIDVAGIIYEGELPEPPEFSLADSR
jgi:hypothetical protein